MNNEDIVREYLEENRKCNRSEIDIDDFLNYNETVKVTAEECADLYEAGLITEGEFREYCREKAINDCTQLYTDGEIEGEELGNFLKEKEREAIEYFKKRKRNEVITVEECLNRHKQGAIVFLNHGQVAVTRTRP